MPKINHAAVAAVGIPFLGFWYYQFNKSYTCQISHNTLFRGIIHYLNTNESTKQMLGFSAFEDSNKIAGFVNINKGKADIEFDINTTNGLANIHFIGKRVEKGDFWRSDKFEIKLGEKVLEL